MDYRNSLHYSKNENIHYLLKTLEKCPPQTTEQEVKDITKKFLGGKFFKSLSGDSAQAIQACVRTLIGEVDHLHSLPEAQQEIAGAINGLNILLKYAKEDKQQTLKQEIEQVSQCRETLEELFFMKEVVAGLAPSHIKKEDLTAFLKDLGNLQRLYDKTRIRDMATVQVLLLIWLQPEGRKLLQQFTEIAHQTRKESLKLLENKQFPGIGEKHFPLINAHSELTQWICTILEIDMAKIKLVKNLIDDLYHNRTIITNTQIHSDGIYLAFNSETTEAVAQRLKDIIANGREHYQAHLQKLKNSLKAQTTPAQAKKIAAEIRNWEKLENYHLKAVGFCYQRSSWMPVIGPKDPIQPVDRLVNFATQEGNKSKDLSIRLDLTKALGPGNLSLNVEEKQLLSRLLKACDSLATQDNVIKQWEKFKKFPEKLSEILNEFSLAQYPHLSTLSPQQKEDLVNEAFHFSYKVNYHLADNLLNLWY